MLLAVAAPVQAEPMELTELRVDLQPIFIDVDLFTDDCTEFGPCMSGATMVQVGDVQILTNNPEAYDDSSNKEPTCITLNLANIYSVLSAVTYYSPVALVPSIIADLVVYNLDACVNLETIWSLVPETDLDGFAQVFKQNKPSRIYIQTY